MTGTPFERESRRARKRRKERERQEQETATATAVAPQIGIRDVFALPANDALAAAAHLDELAESVEDELRTDESDEPVETHSEPTLAAPESASEQVAALQHALQEKEDLLHAVTAQLEEAANRLDRLHRAGADRAGRSTSPDAPASIGSGETHEQFARFCSDWEELQFAEQFETLRHRLDEIYDAVTLPRTADHPAAGSGRPAEEPAPRTTDSASKLPGWEAMKAQLLREGAEQHRSSADLAHAPAGSPNDSAADVYNDLPLEPPLPLDTESADRDTLAAAVEDRDVFISHLIRRLRSGSSGRYAPVNWAEVSGAPDDLRESLQEHEARLQELLRMEECDLSLERARLARERARLEQLRRDLERDPHNNEPAGLEADRNERRWLRVFGFGRKGDGEQD